MPVREAAPADTPRWDSRVSKLLSQAAVSVVSWKDEEHPAVSERERALAGEAGAVADRANPFFESTARPERERETRTEAPNTGTLVVEDPASWSRDASSAFKAFACATTSPATLLRYFDALYGNEDPGARDLSATLTIEDGNVALTARSSDLVLVLSALAASDSDEVASETASCRLGELAREREPSKRRRAPPETSNGSPEATRVAEARESRLGPMGPPPHASEVLVGVRSETRRDGVRGGGRGAVSLRAARRETVPSGSERRVPPATRVAPLRALRRVRGAGARSGADGSRERGSVSVRLRVRRAPGTGDARRGRRGRRGVQSGGGRRRRRRRRRVFSRVCRVDVRAVSLDAAAERPGEASEEQRGAFRRRARGGKKPHPRRASRGADGLPPARPPNSTSSPAPRCGSASKTKTRLEGFVSRCF